MIVVMNRLLLDASQAGGMLERLATGNGELEGTAGFVEFRLLAPAEPEGAHIVMTVWESREDFEAWTKSDAFRRAHGDRAAMGGALRGRPVLESYEVVATRRANGASGAE